jgi:hypothetical protein
MPENTLDSSAGTSSISSAELKKIKEIVMKSNIRAIVNVAIASSSDLLCTFFKRYI